MILTICAFTQKGNETCELIKRKLDKVVIRQRPEVVALKEWTKDAFSKHIPIVFVGACGIAVRTIAPFVEDKLSDSPVIVIDEKGEFVIPILSGHIGAANEIAVMIAKAIDATPVLTTATDVEKIFSVDVFARKNYLKIENRDGIKKVSSKLLAGECAYLYIEQPYTMEENNIPENIVLTENPASADLRLIPKKYVLGIGCKKGKTFEELRDFVDKYLKLNNIAVEDIAAITSIDLKEMEEGLNTLACFYHVPFVTYSAERLLEVEGDFTESSFVKEVTGVSNVCERAALCFAGKGDFIMKKTAENGMTLSIIKSEGRIKTWET